MEHLIELRRRLMWAIAAIFAAFVVCFWFAKPIYNLLLWPYRVAAGIDAPIELIYTAPQEFFFTEVKLALFGAIFIAFPVIAAQLYMFVAPGLYRGERKAFLPFLIATPILFLTGAALVYFVAMPLAMKFFLSMQQTGEVQITLTAKVSEYLSLIMTLMLGFGICFQMPVLLTLLARAGLVTSDQLKRYRRHAIVVVFIAAAILTPPDPVSQIPLALPALPLRAFHLLREVRREEARGGRRRGRSLVRLAASLLGFRLTCCPLVLSSQWRAHFEDTLITITPAVMKAMPMSAGTSSACLAQTQAATVIGTIADADETIDDPAASYEAETRGARTRRRSNDRDGARESFPDF